MPSDKFLTFFFVVGIIVLISVAASVNQPDWKSPADWLLAWTSWVGSVVGIVVAAKVFWAGSNAANQFALKMQREKLLNSQSKTDKTI